MAYGLEIGKNEVQILIYTMFADGHVWQGQLDRINELLKLDTTMMALLEYIILPQKIINTIQSIIVSIILLS